MGYFIPYNCITSKCHQVRFNRSIHSKSVISLLPPWKREKQTLKAYDVGWSPAKVLPRLFSDSRSLSAASSKSTRSFWGTGDNLYITSTDAAERWHWAEPLGVSHSSKRKGKDGDQGQLLKLTFILLKLKRNDITLLVDISLWHSAKEISSFLRLNISMSILNEVLAMYATPNWTFKKSSLSVLVLHKRTVKSQFKCGCSNMETVWERGGLVSFLFIFSLSRLVFFFF